MSSPLLDSLPHHLTAQTLLASLTNHDVSEQDLTPGLIFLAASVTLLSGVMMMDGSVEPEEIAHLQQIVGVCSDTDTSCHHLMSRLIMGVQQHQVYLNPPLFLTLCEALDTPQRLLLLALGYEMATSDGHLCDREALYLRAIAQRLQVNPKHMAILEASFVECPDIEADALREVSQYLDPSTFQQDEPFFGLMAGAIHSNLPTLQEAVSL